MGYDFRQYVLQDREKSLVTMVCVKQTAEFFGWDTAFEEWTPKVRVGLSGVRTVLYSGLMKKNAIRSGGKRLRICRDKSKKGWPAGKTNCFRMRGAFNKGHLRQLAEVAGDKFEWMESKYGERIDREIWLAHLE